MDLEKWKKQGELIFSFFQKKCAKKQNTGTKKTSFSETQKTRPSQFLAFVTKILKIRTKWRLLIFLFWEVKNTRKPFFNRTMHFCSFLAFITTNLKKRGIWSGLILSFFRGKNVQKSIKGTNTAYFPEMQKTSPSQLLAFVTKILRICQKWRLLIFLFWEVKNTRKPFLNRTMHFCSFLAFITTILKKRGIWGGLILSFFRGKNVQK